MAGYQRGSDQFIRYARCEHWVIKKINLPRGLGRCDLLKPKCLTKLPRYEVLLEVESPVAAEAALSGGAAGLVSEEDLSPSPVFSDVFELLPPPEGERWSVE